MANIGTYAPYQEPTRNDSVAVGTSSVVVSVPRQAGLVRKNIIIRNISTADADIITVALGANTAIAGFGLRLGKGDTWVDSTDAGYECFQGTITAICATANGVLAVTER